MKRRAELLALGALGLLILALGAVNVLAWQGAFDDDREGAATVGLSESVTVADEEPRPTIEEPGRSVTRTTSDAAGARPTLRLVAARGECYVLVRRGSPEGEVLYEAILPSGEQIAFSAERLWLRIGAAANLDATLDGEPLDLPAGTVDVTVTRAGITQV